MGSNESASQALIWLEDEISVKLKERRQEKAYHKFKSGQAADSHCNRLLQCLLASSLWVVCALEQPLRDRAQRASLLCSLQHVLFLWGSGRLSHERLLGVTDEGTSVLSCGKFTEQLWEPGLFVGVVLWRPR